MLAQPYLCNIQSGAYTGGEAARHLKIQHSYMIVPLLKNFEKMKDRDKTSFKGDDLRKRNGSDNIILIYLWMPKQLHKSKPNTAWPTSNKWRQQMTQRKARAGISCESFQGITNAHSSLFLPLNCLHTCSHFFYIHRHMFISVSFIYYIIFWNATYTHGHFISHFLLVLGSAPCLPSEQKHVILLCIDW